MKSKREKMSEKQLISKLSKVGNPFTLLKMFKNVKQFIASHQSDFPKNDVDDKIYLNISGEFYQVNGKHIDPTMPISSGNLVSLSETSVKNLTDMLGLHGNVSLNELFKELRRAKNIKNYQVILEIIDAEFTTNIPVTKWTTIGFKTIFGSEG